MSRLLTLFVAFWAMFTINISVAGTLTIPMEFEYLAIDGQAIDTNLFNHQSEVTLTAGSHKIAIRYHDMVEDKFSDSHSFIQSAPFIVTLTATTNGQYILQPASGEPIKSPEQFANNPQVVIFSPNQQNISYSIEQTQAEETGFLAKLFSQDKSANSVTTQAAAMTASNRPNAALVKSSNNEHTTSNMPAAMLKHWWQQADPNTRKEFINWTKQQ